MQQQLGVAAVRLGAVRLLAPMVDQRAVAVWLPGPAPAARGHHGVVTHVLFIAPGSDIAAPPRRVIVG